MLEDYTESLSKKREVKTNAKELGVKSTIYVGDKYYITVSDGKNDSLLFFSVNKETEEVNIISDLENKCLFNVEISDCENRNKSKGKADLRLKVSKKDDSSVFTYIFTNTKGDNTDVLNRKEYLEKKFFKNESPKNNLQIQIIYNILDIKKILCPYINNIAYALNSIEDIEYTEDNEDIISLFGLRQEYVTFTSGKNYDRFKKYIEKDRLRYFEDPFFEKVEVTNEDDSKYTTIRHKGEEYIFNVLCLIGVLRQMLAHGNTENSEKLIYNLDELLRSEHKTILDNAYNEKIENIKNKFLDINKASLYIIFESIKKINGNIDINTECIAREYYDFIMLEKFDNFGVSIKKIREQMVKCTQSTRNNLTQSNKYYDNSRDLMYRIFDFIILYFYKNCFGDVQKQRNRLRSFGDCPEKDKFYEDKGRYFYNKLTENNILQFISESIGNGSGIKELKNKFNEEYKDNIHLIEDTIKTHRNDIEADYFCKIIYFLTLFLDGSDINTMLTQLSRKIDNIYDQLCIAEKVGIDLEFNDDYYNFFKKEHLSKISSAIKYINCFSRMNKDLNLEYNVNILYKNACKLFGYDEENDSDLKNAVEKIFNQKAKQHDFRNFLKNNVIKSNRFIYLSRYCNMNKISKLIKNDALVKFALSQIDPNQIDKHYKSICYNRDVNVEELPLSYKINELAVVLRGINNYSYFSSVSNKDKIRDRNGHMKTNWNKKRKMNIIDLYLTILYNIVKNLVNINARYALAINIKERDETFYKDEIEIEDVALTNLFINNCADERVKEYMQKNVNNFGTVNNRNGKCKNKVFKIFRNNIMHLSVIRNINDYTNDISEVKSYYSLYHYILQCILIKKGVIFEDKDYILYGRANGDKKIIGGYSKDDVKTLCAPFGYNLPRFKNLTIEDLFYKETLKQIRKVESEK